MKIIFDRGPLGGRTLFVRPRKVIRADEPHEVAAALDALARAQDEGHWLAGYASYELGYCLTDRLLPLLPAKRRTPLVLFGVFDGCHEAGPAGTPPPGALMSALKPLWPSDTYRVAFSKVKDYIVAGDCYQVNLTMPLYSKALGEAEPLYDRLSAGQPVGHGAYVDLGWPVILSRSPEQFFRIDQAGDIISKPMKGTVARGETPEEDAAVRAWLAASEKDRAENLMIVDLIRNDIGRLAEFGSVRVPALFDIETYTTVHQMTSTVVARLRRDVRLPEIFEALFPCGSVTGAPKIRAMEIIRELEPEPRGVYCGGVGWVAPNGEMAFNVAIRTLSLYPDQEIVLNVGGGLVYDSMADSEYEEALWKSRFANCALKA